MVTYDDLFQVCAKHTAQNYYVGDVIPANKLANARKRYPIPEQERVIAVIDTTVFGSAKTGLAVGETGLHWRNSSVETNRTYMSWHEFASAPITAKGIMPPKIELGGGVAIELAGGGLSKDDAVKLLTDLQHLARSPTTNRPPSIPSTHEQWMLAVNNRQYGPYDLPTIRNMVTEGQFNPRECWVWKEGMPNWEQFMQVPTLAALLRDSSRPPTTPPPLPPSAPATHEDLRPQEERSPRPAYHEAQHHMPSYDNLHQVCAKYSGNGYYVGEAIPQKKLANARVSFSIPDTEQVVALLDTTAFGSNKNGLAICVGGVYWRNIALEPKKLLWTEFASVDIRPKGNYEVEIGDSNQFQPIGALERDDAIKLLSEVQSLINSASTIRGAADDTRDSQMGAETAEEPAINAAPRSAKEVRARVDLNHAPMDDLLTLPGMTLSNSQKLIGERERRGGFNAVEEVGNVLGLPPHQVERLRERVMIEPYRDVRSGGRIIDF